MDSLHRKPTTNNGLVHNITPENAGWRYVGFDLYRLSSGQSANGGWRKQEYVLETAGQYPKKVCFMAWGDKIDQFNIKQGETVEVSVDLESREYNGRWYTDVKAWKVSKDGDSGYRENTYDIRDDYENRHESVTSIDDDLIPF